MFADATSLCHCLRVESRTHPKPSPVSLRSSYSICEAFPSVQSGDDFLRHLKENLLVQFSVASLVILAVIGLVLAMGLSKAIRADAIEDLTDEAVGATTGRLLAAIVPEDLETPMTGVRYDEFHDFVQKNIVSDRTAHIKVWAKDETAA